MSSRMPKQSTAMGRTQGSTVEKTPVLLNSKSWRVAGVVKSTNKKSKNKKSTANKASVKKLMVKFTTQVDNSAFLKKEALYARQQSAQDPMLQLPDKYAATKYKAKTYEPKPAQHPKILEARRNNTLTDEKKVWYGDMPHNLNIPVAGVASNKPYQPRPSAFVDYEDSFHSRPSIKLVVPDILKAILVDDWENVTKNNQLVPLPHPHPVSQILADYAEYETPKRPAGSSHVDILEETLAGLKEYFDKSLGRILLYRFERGQYAEVVKKWNSDDPEYQGKTASDTYGPEHLMRLIVSLPELVAQTNMDQQSVNRLREELIKFCSWLSKNTTEYFVSHYESPTQDYVQKAKE